MKDKWLDIQIYPIQFPCVYIGKGNYPIARVRKMTKYEIRVAKIKLWKSLEMPDDICLAVQKRC